MILIPIHSLKSGMVVARDINIISTFEFNIPLIKKGASLNDTMITKLGKYNVSFVYIESQGTEDIAPSGTIDEDLKLNSLNSIKNIFDNFNIDDKTITKKIINDIEEVSKNLIDNALNNTAVSVNLMNLKSHDDYTYTHSLSVGLVSLAIGSAMGYSRSDLEDLSYASLLHDIGKVSVPTDILNKPSRLTDYEFEKIKCHPSAGENIIINGKYHLSKQVHEAIRSHHEKFDGTGYPRNLKGNKIPEFARIISLADVYDALTSDRPYRNAELPSSAIEFILGNANTHFDMKIIEYFLQKVVAFPEGSIVDLSNGKSAIVTKNHPANIMRPTVRMMDEFGKYTITLDLCHDMEHLSLVILGLHMH